MNAGPKVSQQIVAQSVTLPPSLPVRKLLEALISSNIRIHSSPLNNSDLPDYCETGLGKGRHTEEPKLLKRGGSSPDDVQLCLVRGGFESCTQILEQLVFVLEKNEV